MERPIQDKSEYIQILRFTEEVVEFATIIGKKITLYDFMYRHDYTSKLVDEMNEYKRTHSREEYQKLVDEHHVEIHTRFIDIIKPVASAIKVKVENGDIRNCIRANPDSCPRHFDADLKCSNCRYCLMGYKKSVDEKDGQFSIIMCATCEFGRPELETPVVYDKEGDYYTTSQYKDILCGILMIAEYAVLNDMKITADDIDTHEKYLNLVTKALGYARLNDGLIPHEAKRLRLRTDIERKFIDLVSRDYAHIIKVKVEDNPEDPEKPRFDKLDESVCPYAIADEPDSEYVSCDHCSQCMLWYTNVLEDDDGESYSIALCASEVLIPDEGEEDEE